MEARSHLLGGKRALTLVRHSRLCRIGMVACLCVCRDQVEQAPWQVEAEAKRQEELAAVLAAPRPSDLAGGEGGDAAAAGMEEGVQQAGDAAMAVDGQPE
jgi:hypothetical protein